MADIIPTLVEQVGIMFLLMGLGYLLTRLGILDDHGSDQMSDLVLYAAFPGSVLTSFFESVPDAQHLEGAAYCFVFTLAITAIAAFVARLAGKDALGGVRYGIIFSNSGYLGIPLVQGILGEEYVFYLMMANVALNFLIWTYGIYIVSRDRSEVSPRKVLTNSTIVACVVGFALFMFRLPVPDIVVRVSASLGNLVMPLVMIVLGNYVCRVGVRKTLVDRRLWWPSFLRLIVVPLITLAICLLVPASNPRVSMTMLIMMATPAASLAAIFAEKYGSPDFAFATGVVAFSSLASLVTMPLVIGAGALLM